MKKNIKLSNRMDKKLFTKLGLILLLVGFAVWSIYPLDKKINRGLDLQGGLHLLLEVDVDKMVENLKDRYVADLKNEFKKKDIDYNSVKKSDEEIILEFEDEVSVREAEEILKNYPLSQKPGDAKSLKIKYVIHEAELKRIKEEAVEQGLETIRNRIDQFGVAEPSIQREGRSRIVVQLPGVKDTERAISLIGKTALLEFKLLDDEDKLSDALLGKIPEETEILYQKIKDEKTGEVIKSEPYLVKKHVAVDGSHLINAMVRIDGDMGQPYVSIKFDKVGTRIFGEVTTENVGKRLAIILDHSVYSAPRINEGILGGEAQISGSFTESEAKDLAIVLRSGALPAPVKLLENRTVGPSLGLDSIRKGVFSSLLGSILVVLFMIIYYRFAGLVANIALAVNILILLAVLAYFKATLTLPGIAGIALTIGMAVDANVLIFERIREELKGGKTFRSAVESGFDRALPAILDSNATTILTALILFQFGTGPIRGFAVTLTVGLLANVFCAIYLVRFIFDFILNYRKAEGFSL